MAYDAIINRAGTQAMTPEQVAVARRRHEERHPKSGQYVRKNTGPVKFGKKRRGSIPVREESR